MDAASVFGSLFCSPWLLLPTGLLPQEHTRPPPLTALEPLAGQLTLQLGLPFSRCHRDLSFLSALCSCPFFCPLKKAYKVKPLDQGHMAG